MLKKIFIFLLAFILAGLTVAYSTTIPATPTDIEPAPASEPEIPVEEPESAEVEEPEVVIEQEPEPEIEKPVEQPITIKAPEKTEQKNKTITLKTNVYLEGQFLSWASHSFTSEWTPNSKHSVDGYLNTHGICELTSVTLDGASHTTEDWFFVNSEDFEDGATINANFYYNYTDWNHSYTVTVKHIFNDPNYPGDPMTVDRSTTATPGSHIDIASFSRGHFYFKVSTMPGGAWYLGWFEYLGGQHNSVYGTTSSTDAFGVVDTMIHQNVEINFYYYFYPIPDPTDSPTPIPVPATQTDLDPTATPTTKPTATPTPKPTATPTPTPTLTPTPTPKPTRRPVITATPTPTIPGKTPKRPGKVVYIVEDYGTPLGVDIAINHVGDCFD